VNNESVVPESPVGTTLDLLLHEPVFNPKPAMREFIFIKDMSELSYPFVPVIVTNTEETVFNPESILIVIYQFIA